MKRSTALFLLSSVMFFVLMMLLPDVARVGSALYLFLYALTFALPFLAVLALSGKEGEKTLMCAPVLKKRGLMLGFLFVLPAVFAVIGISALTELFLTHAGLSNPDSLIKGEMWYIFLMYVIIPAVGEELLFRHLPLRLIGRHSYCAGVLISAAVFALIHFNVFQIPYALFAGLLFAFADVVAGSVLPSLTMHLLNNTLSLFSLIYGGALWLNIIFAVLLALALACAVLIVIKFRDYKEAVLITFKVK